jgi:Zinc dependent phospholipase C
MFPLIAAFFSAGLLLQLIFADDAMAWGAGVHMLAAYHCLARAGDFLPSIGKVIMLYPMAFLYGSLAADFFIGKGKSTHHSHDWPGGGRILGEAGNDRELAYAYGFLAHLAADVVAHNFFITALAKSSPPKRAGHVYWEARADYAIGPAYTMVAKQVLRLDHLACDAFLKQVTGKRTRGLKTKKQIYTRSVSFSHYLYENHSGLFMGKLSRDPLLARHLASMVNLSCMASSDFLKNPGASPCLLHHPLGVGPWGERRKRFRSFFS